MGMKTFWRLALASLLLGGCGGAATETLQFDKAKVERVVPLTSEEGSPMCKVHLSLDSLSRSYGERAETINEAVVRRIFDLDDVGVQQAADSFANKYTRDYVKNFAPLYREDRGDELKKSWYEYHYDIDTEVQSLREHTVTYLITLDYYEGGAHGINQQLSMNFDTQTGQLITLDDLFVPGYQQQLRELLLERLLRETDSNTIDELHDKGYLYSMDMFAPENFILGDDEISFVYNPYEIAPYSAGKTELTLSYGQLKKILK